MSDKTRIEWTDATWNPVTGCTKVSEGCDNCYAETIAHRFSGTKAYPDGFAVTLRPERLDQPLRWKRPRMIFVNSMSDLFHADVPDEFIARVFAVMALSPMHTFQILTKRPGRMRSLLSQAWFAREVAEELTEFMARGTKVRGVELTPEKVGPDAGDNLWHPTWPLPNVWLGTSVESQKWADVRIPQLLATPAAVRFLSCEPLLGPVNLSAYLPPVAVFCLGRAAARHLARVNDRPEPTWPDWVIVGGESGPHARPMHPDWARSLRKQCVAAGVAFHFKQWGEWAPAGRCFDDRAPERDEHFWWDQTSGTIGTGATVVRRVGKKLAGRELDGRTWDEHPGADR